MTEPSTFHAELLSFLHRDIAKQIEEGGFDPARDPLLLALQEQLRQALSPSLNDSVPLGEIIDNYQHLFGERGPIHIEKLLMEAFSEKEFKELNLPFPKIYRGLPRLYHRDRPARSYTKKNFSHFPTLKWLAYEKAVFTVYRELEVTGRISLFTWVMKDGMGDYTAALETAKILKERFPSADIHLVAIAHNSLKAAPPSGCTLHLVPYEDEMPQEILHLLRDSELILQIPTYYPKIDELMEKLRAIESPRPMPALESVGEYGFVESSWFHPKTGRRSMGIHFLEKGILTRDPHNAHFGELENETLLEWLFATLYPGPAEIENYFSSRRFYFSYLATPIGGAVYLHALLKSLEHDKKEIDLCTPDLNWFIQYAEMQNREGKPILETPCGVKSIEVYYQSVIHRIVLSDTGKTLRILCPGSISQNDFRTLLNMSGEFVAIRGNQSFSEAVSANKVFFYDGSEHARYFMKDLIAIAENRLREHRGAIQCFRSMGAAFLHNLPPQEEEWVDETYFQEKEDWRKIAARLGLALQSPDTIAGIKKLNRILFDELSCNDFLCHLVQRALCHRKHPEIALLEKEEFANTPFPLFIQILRKALRG